MSLPCNTLPVIPHPRACFPTEFLRAAARRGAHSVLPPPGVALPLRAFLDRRSGSLFAEYHIRVFSFSSVLRLLIHLFGHARVPYTFVAVNARVRLGSVRRRAFHRATQSVGEHGLALTSAAFLLFPPPPPFSFPLSDLLYYTLSSRSLQPPPPSHRYSRLSALTFLYRSSPV